jgi:hypothetical protein
VEHERVNIGPQLYDHAVRHEPADEVNVTAEAIELGDCHRTLEPLIFPRKSRQD